MKSIIMVAFGCLLASTSFAVQAQPMRLEELNLSEAQQAQIRDIRQAQRETRPDSRDALRQERETLRELMASDRDRSELINQFEQVQSLRLEQERALFETMLDIRDILSLEQRQQLAEIVAEQRDQWRSDRPRRGMFAD